MNLSPQEKRAKQRKAKKVRQRANKAAKRARDAELLAGAKAAKDNEKQALLDRLRHAKNLRQARRDPQLREELKNKLAAGDAERPSVAKMLSDMGITGVDEQARVLSHIDKMDADQMLKFMQKLVQTRREQAGEGGTGRGEAAASTAAVVAPHADDVSPPPLV